MTGLFRPIIINLSTSKEERFVGMLGEVEAGNIVLPLKGAWLDSFRAEPKAFPSGKHDDQVERFSQFVIFQLQNWKWAMPERTPEGRLIRPVRQRKRPWGRSASQANCCRSSTSGTPSSSSSAASWG